MKLPLLVVPAALALGCGGKSSSPSTPSSSAPSSMPTAPLPAPAGATVALEGAGDLDGKPGDERIVLYSDGTLHAGGWAGKAELTGASEFWMGEQARITVALMSTGLPAIVVGLPVQEEEDPPNRWQVFVPGEGGLRRILDTTLGVYGQTELRFPGDGTVRYTEDGYTACEGKQGTGAAAIHEITLGLGDGGQLVEQGRTPTGESQACDQLAACPWIYVDTAAGPVKVGEILRDLRGARAYALQELALPDAPRGPLSLRVAEEEDEVTFLDEIYVEADGERVYPTSCAVAAPPAYCAADHVPVRLEKGDVLALSFDLPSAGAPTVFARGYYVPTPTRR